MGESTSAILNSLNTLEKQTTEYKGNTLNYLQNIIQSKVMLTDRKIYKPIKGQIVPFYKPLLLKMLNKTSIASTETINGIKYSFTDSNVNPTGIFLEGDNKCGKYENRALIIGPNGVSISGKQETSDKIKVKDFNTYFRDVFAISQNTDGSLKQFGYDGENPSFIKNESDDKKRITKLTKHTHLMKGTQHKVKGENEGNKTTKNYNAYSVAQVTYTTDGMPGQQTFDVWDSYTTDIIFGVVM